MQISLTEWPLKKDEHNLSNCQKKFGEENS